MKKSHAFNYVDVKIFKVLIILRKLLEKIGNRMHKREFTRLLTSFSSYFTYVFIYNLRIMCAAFRIPDASCHTTNMKLSFQAGNVVAF